MTTNNYHRKRRNRGYNSTAGAGNILCYADQASFMGLRTLGRQPVIHLCWCYSHVLDESVVHEFNERLSQTLLGRLLQRSALPWGRHRWVTNPFPAPVMWSKEPIAFEGLASWQNSLIDTRLDPEHGPGWLLIVKLIEGGGCAMSILVSHTIADGHATIQSIVDAISGRHHHTQLPRPSWRWSPVMMVRDCLETARALPDVARAFIALFQRKRQVRGPIKLSLPRTGFGRNDVENLAVGAPSLHVAMNKSAFEKRALELGVAGNTLLVAFAVRLAFLLGRVDSQGRVKLVLPVSNRLPDDLRGNALQAVSVKTDPETCYKTPGILQRELRSALASLLRQGDELTPLLPLVPYVPMWLARHLEGVALGDDLPVGCSLLGDLPESLSEPCGKGSQLQWLSQERITQSQLIAQGGILYLLFYACKEQVKVYVSCYAADRVTSRIELEPFVEKALSDLGLEEEFFSVKC
jgi:diacylglycerol O-acyltransferase